MSTINHRTKERLFVEPVWFEKHTPEQRSTLINQLEYWRTLPYNEFSDLAIYGSGRQVYQIGELPLDQLLITYNYLTEQGGLVSLRALQQHLLSAAEASGIRVVRIIVSKKDLGNQNWRAVYMKFDKKVGVSQATFKLPEEWAGNKVYHMAPIWKTKTAIHWVEKDSSEVLRYPEFNQIEPTARREVEFRPAALREPAYYSPKASSAMSESPSKCLLFANPGLAYPRVDASLPVKRPQLAHEEDDWEQNDHLPDEQWIERIKKLLEKTDIGELPAEKAKGALSRLNTSMRVLKRRYQHQSELMDLLKKRSRDLLRKASK